MALTGFHAPRRLEPSDVTDGFDCGVMLIDEWIRSKARMAERQGTAAVYVAHDADGVLAGFYSLSAHSVERATVSGGWLRRNTPPQIPAILLGMLGVDRRFQGSGLGRALLHDAALRAAGVSRRIGARALIVDPVDDVAMRFYERNGFLHLPSGERMYFKLAGSV